jgi:hypothetical protein
LVGKTDDTENNQHNSHNRDGPHVLSYAAMQLSFGSGATG